MKPIIMSIILLLLLFPLSQDVYATPSIVEFKATIITDTDDYKVCYDAFKEQYSCQETDNDEKKQSTERFVFHLGIYPGATKHDVQLRLANALDIDVTDVTLWDVTITFDGGETIQVKEKGKRSNS
ncbi:hypothetical protein DH09_02080 [Bacillaceae bacterium JMAK1]|nr:hypothetical protein DH09_02080 [Bacillaceae bacterium JMAK1]